MRVPLILAGSIRICSESPCSCGEVKALVVVVAAAVVVIVLIRSLHSRHLALTAQSLQGIQIPSIRPGIDQAL